MRCSDAKDFASEHELTCLTFAYEDFVSAFECKVQCLENHPNFSRLEGMAREAVLVQSGFGRSAIAADDFMRRIVELPTSYISDWLDGKNNLEWLPEYLSERECDRVVTYSKKQLSLDEQIRVAESGKHAEHSAKADMQRGPE